MLVFDQWSSHPSLWAQTHLSLSSWTRDASAENNNCHLWPLFTAYAIQSYLHFNLMQCWVEHWSKRMSLPMEVPWRYCWESENFKFKFYSIAVLTFFHLHLTLKIRPLADLDSHTYLHSWTLSSRNGRPLINVSSTNFYRAHSLFDFKTSQKRIDVQCLWLSITSINLLKALKSANH